MRGETQNSTLFRDVILLALMGFVVMVLLVLPHINPPGELSDSTSSPGNVIIEIEWTDKYESDVDLWVQGPGDRPVGYSNKGGILFNLLRDDLGQTADITTRNFEISFSHRILAGEYIINLHLYRTYASELPVSVIVSVSVRPTDDSSARRILSTTVQLLREKHELTVFRFYLNDSGQLDRSTLNSVFAPLRSQTKRPL